MAVASIMSSLAVVIVVAALVLPRLLFQPRVNLPQHLLGHTAVEARDIMTPADQASLMVLLKEMASSAPYLPSNVEDTKSYKVLREHIGEATSVASDGGCEHPYMVPSVNRTECILAGRIDIGRHYIKTGGVDSMRELYSTAISRLLSFGRYIFDLSAYPSVQALFATDKFQAAAREVCPAEKQYLDPFQFNFIIQLPGQTVATHLDGVYFRGATRFQFPQWLLAAMKFSGAFEDEFVDQVQVVAYFHDWQPDEYTGGDFVYWNENAGPRRIRPFPRAGTAVDGSKVVHASTVYRPHVTPALLDKSKPNVLRYMPDRDIWEVTSDGLVVGSYNTSDLRATIVYRARCFADQAAASSFKSLPDSQYMSLDTVLWRLKQALSKTTGATLDLKESARLPLALNLLDSLIKYPLPTDVSFPVNYCALARLAPWTATLLRPFC